MKSLTSFYDEKLRRHCAIDESSHPRETRGGRVLGGGIVTLRIVPGLDEVGHSKEGVGLRSGGESIDQLAGDRRKEALAPRDVVARKWSICFWPERMRANQSVFPPSMRVSKWGEERRGSVR